MLAGGLCPSARLGMQGAASLSCSARGRLSGSTVKPALLQEPICSQGACRQRCMAWSAAGPSCLGDSVANVLLHGSASPLCRCCWSCLRMLVCLLATQARAVQGKGAGWVQCTSAADWVQMVLPLV